MNSVPPVPFKRHGTWHAFDAPLERQRLFSPWTVAGFGLALSLGLLLVYPHRTLEQRLTAADSAAGRADTPLTIEYLKVFLKADPGDSELRLQLIRKLVLAGDYAGARRLMDEPQAAGNPQFMREVGWIRLALVEQEFYAAAHDSPARDALLEQMRGQLRMLLQQRLAPRQLALLGERALASDAPDAALTAFRRLRQSPATLSDEMYAQAAHGALGLGDYRLSADLLFIAMGRSAGQQDQRRYFLEAVRNLQAGGLLDEALAAAERHLGPFGHDIAILKFLARLAQSANRPDIAERYAKRFLELSLLQRWQAHEETRLTAWGRPRYAPPVYLEQAHLLRAAAPAGGPGLAFDEDSYSMGYQIFLANRNLADARRVAASAVQQQPQSIVWRRRLAEVSEWDGAPQDALVHWLAYARMTGNEAAWDATLRLSDSLFDQPTLRLALEHKLAAGPGNLQWLNRLLALHELAGAPGEAIALLQSRLDGRGAVQGAERVRELELLAGIQERAGQDAGALETMLRLQREAGPRTGYALKIANFHYRNGAFRLAYEALEAVRPAAAPHDALYWRNYAEVARLLQDDAAAERGYQALLAAGVQSDADLYNLAALLRAERPLAAAALAAYAFRQGGDPALAEQALGMYLQLGERGAARDLLSQLSPAQLRLLEGRASFLLLRANLAQSGEDLAGARRDLRAALALEPASIEARAALIWVLLALRDTAALEDGLRLWAAEADRNEALWDPYAATLMSLNRQDEALRWFRKSGIKKQDYLWLMSYAECLDANAQPDLAWRIRHHVWTELRKPETLARLQPQQYAAMRDRLAALAPAFAGGEASWRILQALLRTGLPELTAASAAPPARDSRELLLRIAETAAPADSAAPAGPQALFTPAGARDDARLSASARELALAYVLNNDANELARAWLASRYASQLARPLWAELSMLLQSGDRDRLNTLLDEAPDWLPMYDRIDAAERAGRPALAQTLAFDQLSRLPHDEALHQRLVNLSTAGPAPLQASVTSVRESPLAATDTVLRAGAALSNGLKMSVTLSERRQHSEDEALLAAVPRSDRVLALAVSRKLDNGALSATLQRREALAGSTGFRVEAELAPARDLQIGIAAGVNQVSTDSLLLRVGGMQSGLDLNATHAFSTREYGRVDLGWRRYRAQGGAALGSGANWRIELGTRLRLEYPDLTLRGFVMGNRFSLDGRDARLAALLPADSDPDAARLLPEGSRTWGLALGAGTSAENGYHRAWRPYGEAGLSYNTVTGFGHQLRAGVAGSVFGQDVLRMRWQRISGNPSAEQGSRELGLDYHLYY
ncbi:MAG: tetratricopeptide repeat protein [Noviherbaspirillum sp.]